MTNPNDTIRQLGEITDAGLFERLATAVLRSVNPQIYAPLTHPGMNAMGKTIKAPADGVCWIETGAETRVVMVAHATKQDASFLGKWLHDRSGPRKNNKKPSQEIPDGDLVKLALNIRDYRLQRENLLATVALTCNREPDAKTLAEAYAFAAQNKIDLDVWSASRIAYHLDNTPEGHWLRKTHLGAPIEKISIALLKSITEAQIKTYRDGLSISTLVRRETHADLLTSHTMLVGESGTGKSSIALQNLIDHSQRGGVGLILHHETIEQATSIDEAIDIELRKIESHLEAHAGSNAIGLRVGNLPFLIAVEDLNAASSPLNLAKKIKNWAKLHSPSKSSKSEFSYSWVLLCPIWPRYIEQDNLEGAITHRFVSNYEDHEALLAVTQQAPTTSSESAIQTAKALGNDPLLIALCDFSQPTQPLQTIERFVRNQLSEASAQSANMTSHDLKETLDTLLRCMLQERKLSPTIKEADTWLTTDSRRNTLRFMLKKSALIRLSDATNALAFRHDRVLYTMLSDIARLDIHKDCFLTKSEYLSDPYYSEILGMAISRVDAGIEVLEKVGQINPLALFHAFHFSAVGDQTTHQEIAETVQKWLEQPDHLSIAFNHLRYEALKLLATTDSEHALDVLACFPTIDQNSTPALEAYFRNGNLSAGLYLLTQFELGVTITGRHEFLMHVFQRFGNKLVASLIGHWNANWHDTRTRKGRLRLAGYLGLPEFGSHIRRSWKNETRTEVDLVEYLWAAARCCGDKPEEILIPICDAWHELPVHEENDSYQLTRSNLAADHLSWEFRNYVPKSAIPFFVTLAASNDDLAWPITYMLRNCDDPNALEHIARYFANLDDTGKSDPTWMAMHKHTFIGAWARANREGIKMSARSKERLLDLASSADNSATEQKYAFDLWGSSIAESDLMELQSKLLPQALYEKMVWARARRGDQSVIAELIPLLRVNPSYWWQTGRYIWSQALATELRRGIYDSLSNLDGANAEAHWILSERLMELDVKEAEDILLSNWDALKKIPRYVQAALYFATHQLLDKVAHAVEESENPASIFEHSSMHMGVMVEGRTGITRIEQVQAILKYKEYLSEYDLMALNRCCIKNGWKRSMANLPELQSAAREDIDTHALTESLKTNGHGAAWFWIETQTRNGFELAEIMDALFNWLNNQSLVNLNAIFARNLVIQLLTVSGRRADIPRLQPYKSDESLEIKNLIFAIKHRTLI